MEMKDEEGEEGEEQEEKEEEEELKISTSKRAHTGNGLLPGRRV